MQVATVSLDLGKRVVPPEYVKPMFGAARPDAADAEAICETEVPALAREALQGMIAELGLSTDASKRQSG